MSVSRFFTLSRLIRLMIFGGLVATFVVLVQSCTGSENNSQSSSRAGLAQYAKGPLKRLEVRGAPPAQPSLTFTSPGGETMTLADYHGKIILLNVWATWCAPCVVEMPMLNQLQAERGGDNFEVVTISIDRIAEDAQKFLEDKALTALPAWHDGSYALPARVGAQGLPVSIFYNKAGEEIARISGEVDWTSRQANALITHILEQGF